MTGRVRVHRHAALAAAAVVVLAGCGGGGQEEPKADGAKEVRVLLDWLPNPDHLGLYTAKDKGLFTAADLSVKLTAPSNPSDPLKLVAANKVDLGITYEPDVLMSADQGIPVTAVAALIPRALNSLMAVGSSPVKSADDLAGKTIGTAGLPSDDMYLRQITHQAGVDLDAVKKVNVGANLVASMISGKVDATIGAYRNIEGVQLAEDGHDPVIVPVTEAGVPEYDELVVIANRNRLRDDAGYRDTVKRFVGALGKGVRAAREDPAVATASMRKVAKGYDGPALGKMVDATLPLLENPDGFGRLDPAEWKSFAAWLHREGAVKKKIDVGPLVTNDYLPAG